MSDPYFILAIDDQDYEALRMSRESNFEPVEKPFESGTIFLIYIKSSNRIMAEYDLEKISSEGGKDTLHLEPIYNSPEGIVLTDLVLLTLVGNSLSTWRDLLKSDIFSISESDYKEITIRLKG